MATTKSLAAVILITCAPLASADNGAQGADGSTPGMPIEFFADIQVIPDGTVPSAPPNVWTGPGAMPTDMQMTFFVDPQSGSLTFAPCGHVDGSFGAFGASLTTNTGKTLEHNGSGTFAFGGDTLGCGPAGASFDGFAALNLVSGTRLAGPATFNARGLGTGPFPGVSSVLASMFFSLGPGVERVSGSFGDLEVLANIRGEGFERVPEPPPLALVVLGMMGLAARSLRRRAP